MSTKSPEGNAAPLTRSVLEGSADALSAAQEKYTDASNRVLDADEALEEARGPYLLAGDETIFEGMEKPPAKPTVAQREARLRTLLPAEYGEKHEAEKALNAARCELERARNRDKSISRRLRLLERTGFDR